MAPTGISRDSLDSERRGRMIGEDQHKGAIRARARELMRLQPGRGDGGRSQAPTAARLAGGKGASSETVLKVVAWTKDSASPMAQAGYASRTREDDPADAGLVMINEQGRGLQGAQIGAEIWSWDLKAETENQSAAAKLATTAEWRNMPAATRLDKRQAVHMIFSIPSHAKADAARLERAVDLALRETAGDGGFRYVYTIHTDHSARPHAHIIIKAQSEPFEKDGLEKTRQLRLGPKELQGMRQVLTRHAQEAGLNVISTRRQDRQHLRADILAGQAPLRENIKFHQAMNQSRQGRTFEVKAPGWYASNGFEYERRRLAAASIPRASKTPAMTPKAGQGGPTAQTAPGKPARSLLGRLVDRAVGKRPEPAMPPSTPPPAPAAKKDGYFQNFGNYRDGSSPADAKSAAEATVAAHFAATHREPAQAAASFQAMFKEAPRLALWAAEKHPQAFGETSGRTTPALAWKDVRALVDAAPRAAPARPLTWDPFSPDAVLAGERLRLREATPRARATAAPEKAQRTMSRSLERLADRLERETPTDPDSKEWASHIRAVARDLNRAEPATQIQRDDQAGRLHDTAGEKDKAALHRELEAQIEHGKQARAERPATPQTPTAPGAPQKAISVDSRRPGYFKNFENFQNGDRPPEAKTPAGPAPTPQRGKSPAEKAERPTAASLTRLANRIERQAAAGPVAKQQAAHVRELARNLSRGETAPAELRDKAERIQGAAGSKDKAALYRELEAQLRQRDQARAQPRARDRDDSGRDP